MRFSSSFLNLIRFTGKQQQSSFVYTTALKVFFRMCMSRKVLKTAPHFRGFGTRFWDSRIFSNLDELYLFLWGKKNFFLWGTNYYLLVERSKSVAIEVRETNEENETNGIPTPSWIFFSRFEALGAAFVLLESGIFLFAYGWWMDGWIDVHFNCINPAIHYECITLAIIIIIFIISREGEKGVKVWHCQTVSHYFSFTLPTLHYNRMKDLFSIKNGRENDCRVFFSSLLNFAFHSSQVKQLSAEAKFVVLMIKVLKYFYFWVSARDSATFIIK